MASQNITFADIKTVKYTSPSQNLNAVEPNIVEFDSSSTWAKAYTLTIPKLPTGVSGVTVSRTASRMTGMSNVDWSQTSTTTAKTTEVRYGDTIAIRSSATTGYNNPTATLSATTVGGNVTATITAGSVKSYTLTVSSLVAGVSSITVTRTSSPLKGASTGALSNGATIYHGDVLSATASATTGYNNPTPSWTSKTVSGNVTISATAGSVKTYTLSYPAKPTGVSSYSIMRIDSPLGGASVDTNIVNNPTTAGTITVCHGDEFTIGATAATGYNNPTYSLSSTIATGNITATVTAGSVKSYTLSVPKLPTGIASCTISRTSSPLKGASTGTIATVGSSTQSITVYYGDVLSISATATTGYNAPTYKLSSTTVTGNITTTLTAGSVKSFTLSYPAKPSGATAFSIMRIDSPYANASVDTNIVYNPTSAGTITVYYGDELTAGITAATGYNASVSWTSKVITGNTSITASASLKTFTLSYPAKPTGVDVYGIRRTSSPIAGASTGLIVSSPTSAGTVTVYYNDVLNMYAYAATGYNNPTYKLSQTTVTGNVTATVTAGSKITGCPYCGSPEYTGDGNHYCEIADDWL